MGSMADLHWMLLPFLACLTLVGIHTYLGIHVLARKVIFVDLALAQVAAFGATYALLLGYGAREPSQAWVVYLFSLSFTFAGAAIFALTRMRYERVPQEAFIGIVYAVFSAGAILLMAKSPQEGEHLKYMLVGNILLVTPRVVAETAVLYLAVGVFHYVLRRQFLRISLDPDEAQRSGLKIRLWDFVFYLSFGVVITKSVETAGVLLVFCFLVVPATMGVLLADGVAKRLAVGWGLGTLCSMGGVVWSLYSDLPTGPAIVCVFGIGLVAVGALRYLMVSRWSPRALGQIAAVTLVVAILYGGTRFVARSHEGNLQSHDPGSALLAALHDPQLSRRLEAIDGLAKRKDRTAVRELVAVLHSTKSDIEAEHLVKALGALRDPGAVPALVEASKRGYDSFLQLELARAVVQLGDPRATPILLEILRKEEALLPRRQAHELLRHVTGQSFGYDPERSAAENSQALERWRKWWEGQKGRSS